MKKNIYIPLAYALALSFHACQTEDKDAARPSSDMLEFSAKVQERVGASTRDVGSNFFEIGDSIIITLNSSTGSGPETYLYTYRSDHIFRGLPNGYHFSLDDSYITSLTAKWPADNVRSRGLVTDQRLLEDYKTADWMSGGLSTSLGGAIVPTDAPVPLIFNRENVMLDFELVGQNTTGLDIESLLIELQSPGNNGSQAYWAYCDNPNGHAQLIMSAGSRILSPDNYLIGRIRITGQSNDYTIIFPKTDLTLEAGHRYLITLTPQGYFMNAYIYISGFGETTEGIGIPFQQPTPDINGNFLLENAQQLIGLSYLTRNYNDGTSFVWSERIYVLSPDFTISNTLATQYIRIPQSVFTGEIRDTEGNYLTEITDESGETLQLFDPNN
ncbi:MAG: hypothetical protein LUH22_12805 [Bacteroides sp.]|nr:hypothetical protein [Bacteroides sp.]